MKKLNYKLSFVIFLAVIVILFFGITFSSVQAEATVNSNSFNFSRNLTIGNIGNDVKVLQQFLNSHGAQVSVSGPGSPGNETMKFGGATKKALSKWQSVNGISPAAGYFGPKSRAVAAVTMIENNTLLPSSQTVLGLPVRLRIPQINVNAVVEHVGLTSGGAIDSSKGPAEAAWYNLGPRPGEKGSSIIDGHSGWKDNIRAVFDDLYKLKSGDKIYVEDDLGVTTTFMVRESKLYKPNENAPEVFSLNDGKAHLNLITCTGNWNINERTHSDRLVVFADKIE